MGFPIIMCTLLGVPIIRTIVVGGLYWGPLIWEVTIHTYIYICTHTHTRKIPSATKSSAAKPVRTDTYGCFLRI